VNDTVAVRLLDERPMPDSGLYVVYWMHHAVRGHENPALDTARIAALDCLPTERARRLCVTP